MDGGPVFGGGVCKCFSCGERYDIYDLIKLHYGLTSFREQHNKIAELFNELDKVVPTSTIKEDPLDFALWKASKPGEPDWQSPWGKGRPGWHIECSVMAKKYLGNSIDIHCGGQDLIFPHHENEIAQSQCCNDVKFANYWLHNGYINIDNKKMSKSLNNFFTVREISEKYGYEPIRYLMISSHYRSPINYSEEIINQCIASLDRLYKFRENLNFIIENSDLNNCNSDTCNDNILQKFKDRFIKCMEDDLNTADAISVLFDMVKKYNIILNCQGNICLSREGLLNILNLFDEFCKVLGILYVKNLKVDSEEIMSLINKREEARKNKNWAVADKIRDDLRNRNVVLEDTTNGVKWYIEQKH